MSNKACRHKIELFSQTGVTSDTTGELLSVPENVGRFYLVSDVTETSAGGVTVALYTNEPDSETNRITLVAPTALSSSIFARTADGAMVSKLLGTKVWMDFTSVTGEWDLTFTLVYSQGGPK